MRKLSLLAAAAAIAIASPAAANEARVEVRGGWIWVPGASNEAIGVALGYDADLGEKAFAGAEVAADTNFEFASPVLSLTGRLGIKAGESTKLFVSGGYSRLTDIDYDDFTLGAGGQFGLGERTFASVQYQRYLDSEINRISIGLGMKF